MSQLIEEIVANMRSLNRDVAMLLRQEAGVSSAAFPVPGTLSGTTVNDPDAPHTHEIDDSIARQTDLEELAAELDGLLDDVVLYTVQTESEARQNQAQANLRLFDAELGGNFLQRTVIPNGRTVNVPSARQLLVSDEIVVEDGGEIVVEDGGEMIVIGNLFSRMVDFLLKQHLSDFNNPHRVTFDQVELESEVWVRQTSPTLNLTNVAYGNGLFVATTVSNNKVIVSPDGKNWSEHTIHTTNFSGWGITYANGLFVIVGATKVILTSPDGINWSEASLPVDGATNIRSVAYGNGVFVAVCYITTGEKQVYVSSDAKNWAVHDAVAEINWASIAFGGSPGVFVATGASGRIMTSTDGISWTEQTSPFSTGGIAEGVVYGDGVFVVCKGNQIATSTNGVDWTLQTSGVSRVVRNVEYGNGRFLAVLSNQSASATSTLLISIDQGVTWQSVEVERETIWFNIAFGNDVWVIVGTNAGSNKILTSGKQRFRTLMPENIRHGPHTFTDDVEISEEYGVVLTDRDDGTKYRLYIDSGSLFVEAII